MESELQRGLNREWKAACRAIFGREVGNLQEYEKWLCEGLEPMKAAASCISGREIFAVGEYAQGSRFMSFDEIKYGTTPASLGINQIKDIDSLLQAAGERFVYAGNVVLGNSSFVEKSTGLEDCNYALHAHTNHSSQYIAYFSVGRVDRSVFGCSGTGESSYCIKTQECWKATRCLVTDRVWESSDVYFSHNLRGCSSCIFSFGLRGAHYAIGNVQLEPGKYRELKQKLMEEVANELEKKKRLPELIEMMPQGKRGMHSGAMPAKAQAMQKSNPANNGDISAVDEAFAKTCEIIFGKKVGGIKEMEEYLMRHVRRVGSVPSCMNGKPVYYLGMEYDREFAKTGRMIKQEEEGIFGKLRKWPVGVGQDGIGLSCAKKLIEGIAYYCPEIEIQSGNMVECASTQGAHNGWRSSRVYYSKFTAYCFWPRDSDHVFGCDSIRNSSFCINCYNSYKLARCFEADTSQNCTGSLYLHNCENVHDSMFCFNAKNLRYAVGNVEVGREEYMRIREIVVAEIASGLEKEKKFGLDIYNLGSK